MRLLHGRVRPRRKVRKGPRRFKAPSRLRAPVRQDVHRLLGLEAEVPPHPPQALPSRPAQAQGFVLSASRLDLAKRIDLLLDAAALEEGFDVVVVSDGPDRDRLEEVARARGLDGRVRFEGRVPPDRLPPCRRCPCARSGDGR